MSEPFVSFESSVNAYKDWLKTDDNILYEFSRINLPGSLTTCLTLFNKNVIPIKKLVNDIGDLKDVINTDTKNFFLYDDSNFILDTFFTELNKSVQAYGIIATFYNNNTKKLITLKNRLKFSILSNTEREFLALQIEDILTLHRVETEDSKVTNFCILGIR